MKLQLPSTLLLCALALATPGISQAASSKAKAGISAGDTSETNNRLKTGLKQYPEADTNHDGILTAEEARDFLKKMRDGKTPSPATASKGGSPKPTMADVKYGPHERNVLDFWKAKSDKPTPVVVFIHGGGFVSGDKSKAQGDKLIQQCVDAGVSFAAINYRYRTTAPIQDVLRDCARAIQFIRYKSGDWNVDKTRVASYGGSAGAGTSLWLAFHDDLADPKNADPVLRESSRIVCAGANATQFSYDIVSWKDLFGDSVKRFQKDGDGPEFYGFKTDEELNSEAGKKIRADCDMINLISMDDPPVYLNTTKQPAGEVKDRGQLLHHPKHAQAIYDRCRKVGVTAVADIPALDIKPGKDEPADLKAFLFKHLKVTSTVAHASE